MSFDVMPGAGIAVCAAAGVDPARADELARRLGLPLLPPDADPRYAFVLALTPQHLELRRQGRQAPGPVYVDFRDGKAAHRLRFGGGLKQTIARAVGLKQGMRPAVLDVTAGLGKDAFVLAGLGCRVQMLERSAIIAALLQDGLQRAALDPVIGRWVPERLQLNVTDSLDFIGRLHDAERPDVIYLDPMYPERGKAALVKKEMRLLRELVGDDHDAPQLLAAALPVARTRVVVKRPRPAPALAGREPDFSLEAKTTRYDIYLSARKNNTAAPE
jgi:16S rRNA (guanine1516-N2)-methyltransferase